MWLAVSSCSVAKLCQTLCNSMNCSMPGFRVLHYLPEFFQTHVHWVGDAIQPSHSLSPPSPPVLNLSQHQSLLQDASLHQVTKVLELQLQHWSFQWIFRVDFLYDWQVWSPCSPKDSQVFSNTTVQKHKFFGSQLPLWFTGKIIALARQTFLGKVMSLLLIWCLGWS